MSGRASESTPVAHTHGALAHHFEDLTQQTASEEFGMWTFLCTEVMFFGGMFLAYTIYRMQDEATFAAASQKLDLFWGTVNTCVLLTSSLTMALAGQAAKASQRKLLLLLLAATIVLGVIFIGIKFTEYHHKYTHDLIPFLGLPFEWEGSNAGSAAMFFNLYFLLTGVHALHMIIGLGILLVMLVAAGRGRLLGEFSPPVHIMGLYWHFVDIIWVFLFPLLYLVGVR
jgi:cytochrome c oxidase subunit 3